MTPRSDTHLLPSPCSERSLSARYLGQRILVQYDATAPELIASRTMSVTVRQNDDVSGAASRLPRGHRSTKVSIAISEVYAERQCRFPSAAQYAADSDRIKNRLYDHRAPKPTYSL
jgi:hypothetical protein